MTNSGKDKRKMMKVCSPTKGYSEQTFEDLNELFKLRNHCKSQKILIVLDDLHAKVGKGSDMVVPSVLFVRN